MQSEGNIVFLLCHAMELVDTHAIKLYTTFKQSSISSAHCTNSDAETYVAAIILFFKSSVV